MKKVISLFLALLILVTSSLSVSATANNSYPVDIADGNNLSDAESLYVFGGLNGLISSDGHFYPQATCTQADFAAMWQNLYPGKNVVNTGWYTSEPATQAWATQVSQEVANRLGRRITWSGGSPTSVLDRGSACTLIISMINCDSELRRMIGGSGKNPFPTPVNQNPGSGPVCGFVDVASNSYYAEPVRWCLQNGITSGKTPTSFAPDEQCSLAQVITFLWRAQGSPTSRSSYPFYDNDSSHYYHAAACWAAERGLIVDDKIDPTNSVCTRAYLVWAMWKLAGSPSISSEYYRGFRDVPDGASYRNAVGWALAKGITSGTSSVTFSPMNYLTRAEVATFLYRAYGPHAV